MAGSLYGIPVHGKAQGIQVVARLDGAPLQASSTACVSVDLTIDPGLHVYGLPVPEGFIPLSVHVVAPSDDWTVGAPVFPPPTLHQMEGFDESFFIYEDQLSVSVPLTVDGKGGDTALEVTVRYQVCGDRGCFMPQTVELSLPVQG